VDVQFFQFFPSGDRGFGPDTTYDNERSIRTRRGSLNDGCRFAFNLYELVAFAFKTFLWNLYQTPCFVEYAPNLETFPIAALNHVMDV